MRHDGKPPIQQTTSRLAFVVSVCLSISILVCGSFGHAQTRQVSTQELVESTIVDTDKEQKVKAVYLYSFGRFTKWPTRNSGVENPVFTIGVVGASDIGTNLRKIARKRKIGGKSIVVRKFDGPDSVDMEICEILFVSRSVSNDRLQKVMSRLRDTAVLTITESESPPTGTVANFVFEGDGIQFEININEVQHKNLAMDARLLRQGRKMQPDTP